MDRKALSQQHFTEPMMELCDTLKKGIAKQEWSDFNPDPIVDYYGSMVADSLPEMVDESMDEADIAELERDQVQTFGALLFRDMFRQHYKRLRPETKDARWVDSLFRAVAKKHQLPPEALNDDGKPYNLKDYNAPWAGSLGALMGLPPGELVRAHAGAIETIEERARLKPAAASAVAKDEDEFEETEYERKRGFFSAAPPWMVSSLVHTVILLALALVTLDPVQIVKNVLTVTPSEEEGETMEEFALEDVEPTPLEEQPDEPEITPPAMAPAVEAIAVETPDAVMMVATEMPDMVDALVPMDTLTQSLSESMDLASEFSARSTDAKKQMLKKYGGTPETEAAVGRALEWIAKHQLPNGGWSLHHNIACGGKCGNPGDEKGRDGFVGATGLALLPFLGAGQTHIQGKYKTTVQRGLMFLAGSMKVKNQGGLIVGDSRDGAGNMYSHALAAIVLCEAYAMTEDQALAKPAQAALNFIVTSQNKTGGGWRYSPGQAGDTSVVGWMVMALKSGHMGHLLVPANTVRGASLFLDRVSADGGAYYGYSAPAKKASTTAVGLLCRMYLGWDKENSAMKEGVSYLSKIGYNPKDCYYSYYAAQVLRQYGGPEWEKFNAQMSDQLVKMQETKGHASGSWYYPSGHTSGRSGRLGVTSFSTMTLEVYYRHLPLYAEQKKEDDFPL